MPGLIESTAVCPLKIQRDWLETVSSGSLFHSVIVLGKKENPELCPFGAIVSERIIYGLKVKYSSN